MKTAVVEFWRRIQSIPPTLRGITILLWVMGVFVLTTSILPGWEHEDEGPISQSEFWRSGIGPLVLLIGLGMIAVATVIYRGWPWVRHVLMLGIAVIAGSGFVNPDYAGVPTEILLVVALMTTGIGAWFFYFRRDVVIYFTESKSRGKRGSDQEL